MGENDTKGGENAPSQLRSLAENGFILAMAMGTGLTAGEKAPPAEQAMLILGLASVGVLLSGKSAIDNHLRAISPRAETNKEYLTAIFAPVKKAIAGLKRPEMRTLVGEVVE
jgi:hypothetical protein